MNLNRICRNERFSFFRNIHLQNLGHNLHKKHNAKHTVKITDAVPCRHISRRTTSGFFRRTECRRGRKRAGQKPRTHRNIHILINPRNSNRDTNANKYNHRAHYNVRNHTLIERTEEFRPSNQANRRNKQHRTKVRNRAEYTFNGSCPYRFSCFAPKHDCFSTNFERIYVRKQNTSQNRYKQYASCTKRNPLDFNTANQEPQRYNHENNKKRREQSADGDT